LKQNFFFEKKQKPFGSLRRWHDAVRVSIDARAEVSVSRKIRVLQKTLISLIFSPQAWPHLGAGAFMSCAALAC
jgi:hypothetical protein